MSDFVLLLEIIITFIIYISALFFSLRVLFRHDDKRDGWSLDKSLVCALLTTLTILFILVEVLWIAMYLGVNV